MPRRRAECTKGMDEDIKETEEEEKGGADPDGERASSEAGASVPAASGFGGLRLEGMVGMTEEDSDGEGDISPTGDGVGDTEDKGGSGHDAGAADMADN
ncbi:PREDICTED: uncharacterized protein LOC109116192 [Tarenaya hassleriana]|uniref:uncharacterized protein LOC109116192 n=1 Tax=Tarenaya hassleriana TaxID=28532 RepID=UPI0008FD12F2|nr:PREDICTED: uncharacterized protein LOC109116192 [Tarenaya hassleriana]